MENNNERKCLSSLTWLMMITSVWNKVGVTLKSRKQYRNASVLCRVIFDYHGCYYKGEIIIRVASKMRHCGTNEPHVSKKVDVADPTLPCPPTWSLDAVAGGGGGGDGTGRERRLCGTTHSLTHGTPPPSHRWGPRVPTDLCFSPFRETSRRRSLEWCILAGIALVFSDCLQRCTGPWHSETEQQGTSSLGEHSH